MQTPGSRPRAGMYPLRRTPLAASLVACFGLGGAAGLLSAPPAWAQARPAPTALPVAPVTQYGAPVAYQAQAGVGVITQIAPTNIVNWKSFDIGAAAKLTVNQPSASATLLNKVDGGALSPTMVDGMLSANGRVYIYNPNGIVFGKNSQVNVNALVASSLKFDEARVIGGLVLPASAPALGAATATPGAIAVEAGAVLNAANGGLLMLAAPNVINNGALRAPDGQVVLAAGNKVYLASPSSLQAQTLRGLIVEVSNDEATTAPGTAPARATGVAENGRQGSIEVERGNATMIGFAVNQKGLVSATTSVTLNGSIYLYARDQARSEGANAAYLAQRAGKVVLGADSVTQVLPVLDDIVAFVRLERPELPAGLSVAAAMAAFQALPAARQSAFLSTRPTVAVTTAFNPSEVKVGGLSIELQKGAAIVAPNGKVALDAARLVDNVAADVAANPDSANINPLTTAVRIDFAAGSRIDVAGTTNTPMAMESNVIEIDLRGPELSDNVLLRTSPLYASKAQIDIRNGNKAAGTAANISGWLDGVKQNLGQLTAAGGSVSVNSQGAIIQRAGSSIDVSGGWVDYLPGYVNTSKFVSNDALVDISKASAGVLYSAIVKLPNGPDNLEAGYRQGSSAGAVQLSAPVLVMQGALAGTTSAGVRQRDVSAPGFPAGGLLEIGTLSSGYAGTLSIGAPASTAAAPLPGAPFGVADPAQNALATGLAVDTGALGRSGFNRITATTAGNIEVVAPVTLAPGGKLDLSAGDSQNAYSGGALSPGGNISIKAPVTIAGGSLLAKATGSLLVADGVALDLAGRWTNDGPGAALNADGFASGPMALNGGVLNLSVSNANGIGVSALELGHGVRIDTSAGAWLNQGGKTIEGAPGSITLTAKAQNLTVSSPAGAQLRLARDVTLAAYGFSSGGKLTLVGRDVDIGDIAIGAVPADLSLPGAFFQQGGFTSYSISANVNLNVLAGALVAPRALSWQLGAGAAALPSGAMAPVAAPVLYPLAGGTRNRPTTNLSLLAPASPVLADGKRFDAGRLTVREGAQVLMDPGAKLSLLAGEQLTVYGTLSSPGGNIALLLPFAPPSGNPVFRPERSIWFGPNAQVLARGSSARMAISAEQVASGEPLDGGVIEIGDKAFDANGKRMGANGYVVAEAGALFDVSGVNAGTLSVKAGGVTAPPQEIASAGGRIEIRTRDGLLFDGTLRGGGGGANSAGGELDVALDTGGYLGATLNPRTLTVAAMARSRSIIPAGLKPGDTIVLQHSARDGTDLGWFLVDSLPASNDPHRGGQGWLRTSAFAAGGFGRINFKAQDAIAFGLGANSVTIGARDSLVLDAPMLLADTDSKATLPGQPANTATLAAPYVRLGSGDTKYQLDQYLMPGINYKAGQEGLPTAAPSSGGSARLVTSGAITVDLIGNGATSGFADVSLAARDDIRLVGLSGGSATNSRDDYATGSFSVTGKLTLTSAQTYPASLSDFTLAVGTDGSKDSGTLTFKGNANPAAPVYSAGGSVTGLATSIVQGGRLAAPFGTIRLGDANTERLSYTDGSVTTVAGAGIVPFGSVSNSNVPSASAWLSGLNGDPGAQNKVGIGMGKDELALPAKAIVSRAQQIDVAPGALIDASGGGTLYAYAFTAGKGGSRDVLASDRAAGGKDSVFAILPSFTGNVAPVDGEGSGGLAAGDSVYLSAMPGLAAGRYTLLPAHYALLPGAFSISLAPNTRGMTVAGNTVLPDGGMLVSGRLAQSGSGSIAARSDGFIVQSGKVVRSKSEFTDFDATTFFGDKAKAAGTAPFELPADGGYLGFNVNKGTASLLLKGGLRLAAAAGGRAGYADFSAPSIGIVGDSSQSATNAVTLAADQLSALGADSILIGAMRDRRSDGLHLTDLAKSVTLANNAAHPLSAAEVTLVAGGSIRVEQGAALTGSGAPARAAQDLVLDGGGALLRVSGGAQVAVTRAKQDSSTGDLSIATGATIAASGSAYLDATRSSTLRGAIAVAPGGALAIGARGIDLGSALPHDETASGVQFDQAGLDLLSGLSELLFNSYGTTINLYGNVSLGNTAMRSLTFKGAGIRGFGSAAAPQARQASLTAGTVRFDGVTGGAVGPRAAAGSLSVNAGRIDIGSGEFALSGYSGNLLSASGEIVATGRNGRISSEAGLTLSSARIATTGGADASFVTGGTLALLGNGGPQPQRAAGMGGALGFGGADIISNATIVAPSGQLRLAATNRLSMTGGLASVAGAQTDFGSVKAYAPGGRLALSGASLEVRAGAVLDVSATGAAAGTLELAALAADGSGALRLDGTLRGAAQPGADGQAQTQGRFVLDTDSMGADGQFGALNGALNAAGFTESRQVTLRHGDLVLGGDDRIVAHDVLLSADNGNITIGGNALIDASGPKGGSIALYAGQGESGGAAGSVTLAGQARLAARATVRAAGGGAIGNGGRVVIGISSRDGRPAPSIDGGGTIRLDGGSIDVSGADSARDGSVTLRAPRVGDAGGTDVAIASLDSTITGSATSIIDGYQVYTANSITDQADSATNLDARTGGLMYTQAASFAANHVPIFRRFGWGGAAFFLSPGIEVRNDSGKLQVSVNEFAADPANRGWDLQAWRFGGAPVQLALRSAGDLTVTGSISDGYVKPDGGGLAMPDWALARGLSASYQLAAGARLGAANPLAVVDGTGDLLFEFAERSPSSAARLKPTDAPVALVRTGIGRIDVAAGRDVTLAMAKFWRNGGSIDVADTAAAGTNLYGAMLYTAGEAATLPKDFVPLLNQLNTQYGAAPGTTSAAAFGEHGGGVSIAAGRDFNGPVQLKRSYHLPGTAAVPADKPTHTPAEPAVQGDLAYLPGTVPQLINNWLFRQGRSYADASGEQVFETLIDGRTLNTAWWTRTDYFNQGVATFGGGDLRVTAGRNIANLAASVATSAYVKGAPGSALTEFGGGDLMVKAGGDILGGQFYVQKGVGSLHADGALAAGNASFGPFTPDQHLLNPVLAMGDARFDVSAGGDLAIEGVFNPTMTAQSLINRGITREYNFLGLEGDGGIATPKWRQNQADPEQDLTAKGYRAAFAQFSNFSTYGAASAVQLTAIGGNLNVSNDAVALSKAGVAKDNNSSSVDVQTAFSSLYTLAPSNFRAAALSGDLSMENGFALAAAPHGQLDLLAAGNLTLRGTAVRMLDNDPAATSSVAAPRVLTIPDLDVVNGTGGGIAAHTLGNLHAGDETPVHVIARQGDLVGEGGNGIHLDLPKTAVIAAGRDIRDLGFRIQQVGANDTLSVTAGRDFIDSTPLSLSKVSHTVTGPGRVELTAGRNIDLGNGGGLITRGNLDNPYLSEGGAAVQLVAGGALPDYAAMAARAASFGFVGDIDTVLSALTAAEQGKLIALARAAGMASGGYPSVEAELAAARAVFATLTPAKQAEFLNANLDALRSYVRTKTPALAASAKAIELWVAFRALPKADQDSFLAAQPAIAEHLAAANVALADALKRRDFEALNQRFYSGLVDTAPEAKLTAFDGLIASLFPSAKGGARGDIALYNSQVRLEQGGSADLFAPTGSVYAGLTSGKSAKKASEQGLFAFGGGSLRALVKNDFLVNQGRVFAVGGGDIDLVAQYGNIDAGKGAKTAASAPPPSVSIDANGNVKVDYSAFNGSGIATFRTKESQRAGNIYVVAPRGIFDAGDAGVRSEGSVKVTAEVVLNADNISAVGAIAGASPPVAPPSAAPAAPANSATKADDVAKAVGGDAAAKPGALAVEVVGFGADAEGSGDEDEEEKKKRKRRQQNKEAAPATRSAPTATI